MTRGQITVGTALAISGIVLSAVGGFFKVYQGIENDISNNDKTNNESHQTFSSEISALQSNVISMQADNETLRQSQQWILNTLYMIAKSQGTAVSPPPSVITNNSLSAAASSTNLHYPLKSVDETIKQ